MMDQIDVNEERARARMRVPILHDVIHLSQKKKNMKSSIL